MKKKNFGTCGSLSLIDIELREPFFVTNGDVLSSLDYESLLECHKEQNVVATMCIREENYQTPYGVIEVNGKNNIVSIKEKPIKKFYINTGIYVLEPEVLNYIPKNEFFDLPSLFRLLKDNNKNIKSYKITDYWIDIGEPSDYKAIKKN